uniref:Uncharacterized protein n=1 Tax=Leersia perrieri TaxID=77586 RepID=A0A0D9WE88_9ORYZ
MSSSAGAEQPDGGSVLSARRREEYAFRRKSDFRIINDVAVTQAIVAKLVTGTGFLSLTWSTVVLLGGFVSVLPIKEFWFLSTVLASTVLSIQHYSIDTFTALNNAGLHLLVGGLFKILQRSEYRRCGFVKFLFGGLVKYMIKNSLSLFILVLIEAAVIINLVGPMASVVISVLRLAQHNYDGTDEPNKGKLRAAFFIFYSLALTHGVCFYCWFLLQFSLMKRAWLMFTKCGLEKYHWCRRLRLQYVRETVTMCANDLTLPNGWNLVTYAVGLLETASQDDHLDGLRMLDVFVVEKTRSIRLELLSSRQSIENLITMLEWTSPDLKDQEMRERAARIMADVADALHVAQMPTGALQCISSLLEASPQKHCLQGEAKEQKQDHQDEEKEEQQDHLEEEKEPAIETSVDPARGLDQSSGIAVGQDETLDITENISLKELLEVYKDRFRGGDERVLPDIQEMMEIKYPFKTKGTKELIHQGLQILEKLAYNEHNCREICKTSWLLPKITVSITSPDFLETEYDNEWVNTLSILLKLVMRLISAPGEAGTSLSREISASKDAVHNLLGILDGKIECSMQLQKNAMEILTEIAIGGPAVMTENLVKKLREIFLANDRMSTLRIKAGKSLVKLLSVSAPSFTKVFSKSESMDAMDVTTCDTESTIVAQLTDILFKDMDCRTSAATILEYLCSYAELSNQDILNLLMKIVDLILSCKMDRNTETVIEAKERTNSEKHNDIENQLPQHADQKSLAEKDDVLSEERKYLAALLSILVVICHKLVQNVHSDVISVNEALVKKLNKIIDTNNENTADCLGIAKLACQVVVALIQLKPSCLKDFQENNFLDVLHKALKKMSDIDTCMLFAVKDHELTKPTRTLSSLVKDARKLLKRTQETGNSSS